MGLFEVFMTDIRISKGRIQLPRHLIFSRYGELHNLTRNNMKISEDTKVEALQIIYYNIVYVNRSSRDESDI